MIIITKKMWIKAINKLDEYFCFCPNDMLEYARALEIRYEKGERSRELYNCIMELENR